jgi:hypothetical protein
MMMVMNDSNVGNTAQNDDNFNEMDATKVNKPNKLSIYTKCIENQMI